MSNVNPHNTQQKGSKGEIHDGRPDKDHEAELRGVEPKEEAHEGGKGRESEEVEGK